MKILSYLNSNYHLINEVLLFTAQSKFKVWFWLKIPVIKVRVERNFEIILKRKII
jgi:hypothetical protein